MKQPAGRRILLVCPDYRPNVGGEAELAFGVARGLERNGNAVTVLAPAGLPPAPEDAELSGSVMRQPNLQRFHPLSTVRGWFVWPASMIDLVFAVRRAAAAAAADFSLLTTYMTCPTLAVRLSGLPYAFFLHGEEVSLSEWRGGLAHRLFLEACRSARRIFFNSEYSRSLLLEHLPELATTSEAVGCGVRTNVGWTVKDRDRARRTLGWGEGPVLLTIANLYRKKGIQTVIRALRGLRSRYPSIRYVVVGNGPCDESLLRLAGAEGVAETVDFRCRVEHETKERLFAASDVYVMASQPGEFGEEKGFGISFLEANMHGLPVVGTWCGGIPEAVEHDTTGLLRETALEDFTVVAPGGRVEPPGAWDRSPPTPPPRCPTGRSSHGEARPSWSRSS